MRTALLMLVVAVVVAGVATAGTPQRQRRVVFTQYVDNGPASDDILTLYDARVGSWVARRLTDPCIDCADNGRWSPDGTMIAYYGYGTVANANSGIFLVRPDGSRRRRLCGEPPTATSLCEDYPAWSPDGREVAFALFRGGIGIESVDGGRVRRVPHTSNVGAVGLDWSPDGETIAFGDAREHASDIKTIRVDGTGERRYAGDEYTSPRWSPDGKRLLYLTDDHKTLAIADVTAGTTTRLPRVGDSYSWYDVSDIFYVARDGLRVLDLATRRSRWLGPLPAVCDGKTRFCASFDLQTR